MLATGGSTRPEIGPWLDEKGNALCEECGGIMDPSRDGDAPWIEVRFRAGVKIEIWHTKCEHDRYRRLSP